MSRVRVKICGITRLEDALLAASLGADALGFNLWPGSKRHVDAEAARAIVDRLPPLVTAVGVFVNQPPPTVMALAAAAGVQVVQLHGDERWEDVNGYPLPALKAVRLAGPESLADLHRYRVRGFLLDAPSPGYGGSGDRCDWALARQVAAQVPVLLAGGLTPENVAEAVRTVRPWAVDVASGVEAAPGVKDPDKLRRFIERATQETP
ncbi:phosphoribosylanthranilate isomerase [Anaeromyxobacter diazotrophicus]|uniref:N-(5'-phosphoribosyl)anthranilate isomerase n=1 Tax=Anaeromyxobacter diazotrophicus TaxID=2590199 RepID=A0A7I9VSE4_9BACT|nr:phosphoribosylanthranilate isomerase [Anaeromyxobacter diazotrophicus]GEJ59374.1 N-(5'-phosphoribosyl)anthranilate isomerase [Anaeromyxobacter diazotrophicus]